MLKNMVLLHCNYAKFQHFHMIYQTYVCNVLLSILQPYKKLGELT